MRHWLAPPALWTAGLLMAWASLALPAVAQDPTAPSPEKGLALAQRLCANCHVVEGTAGASVPAGVPTLRGIANRNGQTGQRIMDVLIQPHTPMPDLRLSIDEIADVVAYLETLRTNQSTPPLQIPTPPHGRAKRSGPS